jgi:predicted acyl esterase
VTYITEGMMRVLHRKPLDRDPLAGALGPRHSFLASDTAPLVPGEAAELRIALEPISVLVRSGHRIRIAVAGADASNFVRIPAEGNVRITVLRDREHPSFVELPFMQ